MPTNRVISSRPFKESSTTQYECKGFPPIGLYKQKTLNHLIVSDCLPFLGSGTTFAVAHRHKRLFTGVDCRASQISLTLKRMKAEFPCS